MPTTLTEEEKNRVRYHLGYPLTTYGGEQAAAGIQFGIGRPQQTNFLLEQALQILLTDANSLERVRILLARLDKIESQMVCALPQLGVEQLGEITLRGADAGKTVTDLLEREYRRWGGRLAEVLGVPYYPFSERYQRRGPGSNFTVG